MAERPAGEPFPRDSANAEPLAGVPRTSNGGTGLLTSALSGTSAAGTGILVSRCQADNGMERAMGRYLLLWLLGVPIPILILIWAFGGLH
jgi:hypothetical protein